jgi:hypothetical protein
VLNTLHSFHILKKMNGIHRVCMQDFFRCEDGFQDKADVVTTKVCKKRVVDMHYEARIQAIISFHGSVLGEKVTKTEARTMSLTAEQYLQVNKDN